MSQHSTLRRHLAIAAFAVTAVISASVPASAAPTKDDPSLASLQQERDSVRSRKASKAGQVNALNATDAQVSAALTALNAQVSAQQDKVEEAERALTQAEADRAAAEAAQAKAQSELDQLRGEMKRSAVDAYVNIGSSDPVSATDSDDINVTVNKRMLLDVKANERLNIVERFRSVQEDLELQRAAASNAEQRAAEDAKVVSQRKAELDASYSEQQKFADAIDQRLDQALSEAASLESVDKALSSRIQTKQAQIAAALAAQRKAEAARAAQRAAARKPALGSAPSSGSGSSSGGDFTPPTITGSGSIVTVGGIRVHQSIAANLQALLSAAAADGIHFGGGGYRDPAGQIAVRRSNCGSSSYAIYQMSASSCRPPTARPGSSMHEQGLAIDFTQGGSTLTRGSSGFHWMQANAGRFGFQNLPAEPWHWSVNGR